MSSREINKPTQEQAAKARRSAWLEGGSEAPCPFCGRKRFKMSDYIRCHLCGINWLPGDDLDADPKIGRFQKMKADMELNQKKRPHEED